MSTFIDELFEVGLSEIIDLDVDDELDESLLRADGSSYNLVLRAGAAMGAEIYWQAVDRFAGTFMDTSRFEALSRWVADRYAIERFGATAAVVSLTFSRTTTTAEVTINAGTVVTDQAGTIQFLTDIDLVLPIGVASGSVDATSSASGKDQQAAAGTLTVISGSKPQSDLTVTNAQAAAGGNDSETDAEFRSRARGIFVNARRGTLSAIEQGAFSVPQVRNAAVYEFRQPDGCQTGIVGVVISDSTGNCNDTVVELVEQELENWRGAGIYVVVEAATPILRPIGVTPFYEPGQATPAVKSLIKQTITARVNSLRANAAPSAAEAPADSWLTPGIVEQAALAVAGVAGIIEVTAPAGVEKPNAGERFLTTEGLVSVN
jgi:uncharacterized phage protein gp47/JayE